MGLIKKKSAPISPQYLEAIVRGLSHVANCASDLSLTHYRGLIQQFFDYDEEAEAFIPKKVDLQLDDDHIITMPLIAVTDAKGLYLDELDVEFAVKVTGVADAPDLNAATEILEKSHPKFIVDLAPGSASSQKLGKDIITFKAKFKSNEAPECVMKVIDKYNSQISPRRTSPLEPESSPTNSSQDSQQNASDTAMPERATTRPAGPYY